MQVVRAFYDGENINPIDPITAKEKSEVLIIFPGKPEGVSPEEARRLLRGSGKGENLTEKLLQSRADDLANEKIGDSPEVRLTTHFPLLATVFQR